MRTHRNKINLLLHAIGIPLIFIGIFSFGWNWKAAVSFIVAGIITQEFGHTFEREMR